MLEPNESVERTGTLLSTMHYRAKKGLVKGIEVIALFD